MRLRLDGKTNLFLVFMEILKRCGRIVHSVPRHR